jgi:hypothetical protein
MDELDLLRGRMRRAREIITFCKFWRKISWISLLSALALVYFFFWICIIALLLSIVLIVALYILQDEAKTRYKQDLHVLTRGIEMGKYPAEQLDQEFQLTTQILNAKAATHPRDVRKGVRKKPRKCCICKLPLEGAARKLECPRCHANAHKSHFLAWIRLNHSCPRCGTRIYYKKFVGLKELQSHSHPEINWKPECRPAPPPPSLSQPATSAPQNAPPTENVCCVCKLPITQNQEEAWCPYCFARAHRTHLLEWVKIKGSCPSCSAELKLMDFITLSPRRKLCYVTLE